ncbi:hypothetical protein, partial [Oribacterium sp. P6A1]|uniref:hypothetical protein n=1 Tax=Oribacterium sp. P6A1 TaxID=1410612 RepID=UPI001A9A4291
NLEPGQKVLKNPLITSNVNYESWLVMRVNIPTVSRRLSDEASVTRHDAVILAKNGFEEVTEPAVGHKLGEDTVLLSKYEHDGQTVYYYGFLEPLQPKEKDPHETPTLFDYFRVELFAIWEEKEKSSLTLNLNEDSFVKETFFEEEEEGVTVHAVSTRSA